MNQKNRPADLSALRAELVADIEALSDEELLREAQEAGEDVERIADEVLSGAREAAAKVLRAALSDSKAAVSPEKPGRPTPRPMLNQLKKLVRDALEQQPGTALAFREGRAVSDADWMNLYDDLVALGAIKPESHED